jgi:preprotein translocase subunit SecG
MLLKLLTAFQFILAAVLLVTIMLQHGKGADAGAGFGSGASGTVFGARGAANFLSRTTAIAALLFFANCVALTYLTQTAGPSAPSLVSGVKSSHPAPAPTQAPIHPAGRPAPLKPSPEVPTPRRATPASPAGGSGR